MKKALFVLLLLPLTALAQMVLGPPLGMMMTSGFVYSQAAATLSQDVLRESRRGAKAPSSGPSRSGSSRAVPLDVRISAGEAQRVARELAGAFPGEHRDAAAEMYGLLFKTYEGSYPRTMPGALAALLVGSYAAFNNVVVPDSQSLAVMKQLEQGMRQRPESLQAIRPEDRKQAYIQMVMLGMQLMASAMQAQQAGADPAMLERQREAGRRNLEQILKVPAGSVTISGRGIRAG